MNPGLGNSNSLYCPVVPRAVIPWVVLVTSTDSDLSCKVKTYPRRTAAKSHV